MKVYNENFAGLDYKSWEFEQVGLKGVGTNHIPILGMDKYIDTSMNEELHAECSIGLALCNTMKMGGFSGSIPPFEQEKYDGLNTWTELLREIEKYDPTGFHTKNIEEILRRTSKNNVKAVYRYVYFAMGAPIPWFFAVYLLNNSFGNKTNESKDYTEDAKYFPKLIEYINSLPFKQIGRILFFTTFPHAEVVTHRDGPMIAHRDHNINLFFVESRKSFVWNDTANERHYLDLDQRSYFFNNRDYHGVEAEKKFRYTLRVDGTFEDWLQEDLGLVDGYTWHPSYD